MVEHGKSYGSREGLVPEWKHRSVALHGPDVRALDAPAQRMHQAAVNFDNGQLYEPPAQPVRCEPNPRAYLEDILAEIETIERPRENLTFEPLLPISRTANPSVNLIH